MPGAPKKRAETEAGGRGRCQGVLPRLLCPQYSRVGGGRDPHDQEVVFLAEEPPQPLVVPADVQVPDVEALGWRGGREEEASGPGDRCNALVSPSEGRATPQPSPGHSREGRAAWSGQHTSTSRKTARCFLAMLRSVHGEDVLCQGLTLAS